MEVVLIAVISLDGRITRPHEPGPRFASAEDQAWFARALQEFDCSVLGRETFFAGQNTLPAGPEARRLRVVMTRDPARYSGHAVPGRVEFSAAPADQVIARLRERGHRRCALLGGGQIYRVFVAAGLVDACWITLEPVVLGGGRPLIDGEIPEQRFALVETRPLSADTLLLNYRRTTGPAIPLPAHGDLP